MDAERLHDRISRGMGNAARVIGEDYDLFRPRGSARPLAPENRIMRLPVIIDWASPNYQRPRGFERALRATFDGISALVGDYIRGPRGVLFIAALPLLSRPSCVLTNMAVDVLRATPVAAAGLNAYGGVQEEILDMILADWPAQLVAAGSGKSGALPADGGQSAASIVLPATPVPIRSSDILQDGFGRRSIIRVAEQTEMGWRLSVAGMEV